MASSLWSKAGGESSANRRPFRIIPKTQTSNLPKLLDFSQSKDSFIYAPKISQNLKKSIFFLLFICRSLHVLTPLVVRSTLIRGKALATPDHPLFEPRSLTLIFTTEERKQRKKEGKKGRKKERKKERKKKRKKELS